MLYATVRQRKIHVKNPVTVIQNGIGVDWLVLDMDDEWQDMTSIVCVFTNGDVAKEMLHTFGQPVQVPWECLAETGLLSVSVTGYVGSEKVMTTMKPDSFWNVVQNGPTTGDTPMEPTATLYEQVLAAAGAANEAATRATQISTQLEQDRENGVFDGEDGVTPVFSIGTVLTGASGSEAQVSQTGTPTDIKLNFVIPRGLQGTNGKDGKNGNSISVFSVTESNESGGENVVTFSDGSTLKVKNGKNGKDGEGGSSGSGVYIGPEEPTDEGVKVWIDTDEEAENTLTAESIKRALGFAPADAEKLSQLSAEKVSLPMDGETPMQGTAGEFAVSDGNGGVSWKDMAWRHIGTLENTEDQTVTQMELTADAEGNPFFATELNIRGFSPALTAGSNIQLYVGLNGIRNDFFFATNALSASAARRSLLQISKTGDGEYAAQLNASNDGAEWQAGVTSYNFIARSNSRHTEPIHSLILYAPGGFPSGAVFEVYGRNAV